MKSLLSVLFAFVAFSVSAVELPPMSNGGETHWLYVQFTSNSTVVEDLGANAELRNREARQDADGQLWKISGRQDSCLLMSRQGNYLYYNRSNNRFIASATERTAMKLVENNNGKWELQIYDEKQAPASGSIALVMNGGSGTDKYLDLWKHNFAACGLEFIEEQSMEFRYQGAPATPAEASFSGNANAPSEKLSLWYNRPANNWTKQALPIGNGNMGAMIFGGITQDRIQFNHKTLWKGTSASNNLGSYLAFGDLYITETQPTKAANNYVRTLDLKQAVATVEYGAGGASFRREYLASYPDEVIAIHYEATDGGEINVELQLINAQGEKAVYQSDGARFSGTLGNGMLYCAAMSVNTEGGTTSASATGITVSNARAMTILLSCATDFDPTKSNHLSGLDPATEVERNLDAATQKDYVLLRDDHIADHSSLFDRVDFVLDKAVNTLPTNTMLTQTSLPQRSMTDMLVFAYGRYLTIASSRGADVPSNLQGIWNKDGNASSSAVWGSDIHTNINVQMNYWPVESTNLSECHMPLLNFLRNEALRTDGGWQRNARNLGIDEGWVVNTASNIFGGSSNYKVGKYSVANAWLCDHLWQHYAYTLDHEYLRDHAWPVMRSACRFWLKRLVEASDGTLECPYEYSPEQGRVQNATAHAQQLVGMLFQNSLNAIAVLDNPADTPLRDSISTALPRLDSGMRIDRNGLLREWKYQENTPNLEADKNYYADDEQNVWQCHRHTSHLVGLYPGFIIDKGTDADIFQAAVASLADRGDVGTGWARAWRISLWARARDAAHAYTTLRGFAHHTEALSYDWHGGLYDNMLDAHATSVFQMEGNFGATAGIAEMLLQSRPDSLILLPALPDEWADGHITGLKAIGNFEIGLTWKKGRLTTASIKSLSGGSLVIAYPGINKADITTSAETSVHPSSAGQITLQTEKGMEYILTMPDDDNATAVSNIREQPIIKVEDGVVSVSNSKSRVTIHDLAGQSYSVGKKLTPGMYIINDNGEFVRTIIVR
ncbi:MAG: glycoside hydrolase N-terminal domain-containing protein [Prevotellaceae bacterium]|nr:glycoside hydrolase N-terminal domain-containing protein [Prevotellaceae bacterium]